MPARLADREVLAEVLHLIMGQKKIRIQLKPNGSKKSKPGLDLRTPSGRQLPY